MPNLGLNLGLTRAVNVTNNPILNRIGGSVAAYSLRKISSTADKCIRVRRDNDNEEQDIGFVGRELDTASLLSFVGSNSAYVTTWYDQSGNENDATQSTADNQPKIVSSGTIVISQSGKPSVQFTASDSTYLQTANNMTNDSSLRVFMHLEDIAKPASGSGNFYRSNSNAGGVFYINASNSQKYAVYNGTVLNSNYVGDGDSGGIFSVYQGSSAKIFRNGVQIISGNSGTNSFTDKMNIGCGQNAENFTTMLTGEYIFYNNSALSDSDRTAIERNQGRYYDITLT